MKNSWAIINSDLTCNEKKIANWIMDIYCNQKGGAIKAIKTFRQDAKDFPDCISYTEVELLNVCRFHNINLYRLYKSYKSKLKI
jgi:hypothetical protein